MPLPAEPLYPTALPFVVGGGSGALSFGQPTDEIEVWRDEPSRLDLSFMEGDDISIPLLFSDPVDPTLDMSNDAGWAWHSQVRYGPTHRYWIVFEFDCYADPRDTGVTQVTLILPRLRNQRHGDFYWDLQSMSPEPEYRAKTWMKGEVEVHPQITEVRDPNGVNDFVVYHGYESVVTTGQVRTIGPHGAIG